jgi:hypothetical protein
MTKAETRPNATTSHQVGMEAEARVNDAQSAGVDEDLSVIVMRRGGDVDETCAVEAGNVGDDDRGLPPMVERTAPA